MTRKFSLRHYEEVFEELMRYTDFNSTDEIDSQAKLDKFFDQVDAHAVANGRRAPMQGSFRFQESLKRALQNFNVGNRRVVKRRPSQIAAVRSVKELKRRSQDISDFTFINAKKEKVFKTFYISKGRKIIRWRNERGYFAQAPE